MCCFLDDDDFPKQETCRICIECNKKNNNNIIIECIGVQSTHLTYKNPINKDAPQSGGKLLLRCNKGHLFSWYSSYFACLDIKKTIDSENKIIKNLEEKIKLLESGQNNNYSELPSAPVEEIHDVPYENVSKIPFAYQYSDDLSDN